jgi:ADP-dependent phosphofructokinase/glucokinase
MPKKSQDDGGALACENMLAAVASLLGKLEKTDTLKKTDTLQEAERSDDIYKVTNQSYSKTACEGWIMKFDNIIGATFIIDGRMVRLRKGRSGLNYFLGKLKQAIQEEKNFKGQWDMITMRLERIHNELKYLM